MTGPDAAAAGARIVRLTFRGEEAQEAHRQRLSAVESRWQERFGKDEIERLRESLLSLVDQRDGDAPRLSLGLAPSPGGWRGRRPYVTQTEAMLRDPSGSLPHYPMVSHRGGYPDGS